MNELRQKVRRIKLELNLSDRELSKRLGKSPTYLSKIFEVGISTARQKALSDELDMVAKGHKFVSTAERLEIVNKQSEHNRICATKYLNQVNDLKRELKEARDKYQALNTQAIGDMLDKNSEIQNLKSMLDKVDSVNDELREQLGIKNRNALIQKFKLKKLTSWNYFLCAVIILLIVIKWGV